MVPRIGPKPKSPTETFGGQPDITPGQTNLDRPSDLRMRMTMGVVLVGLIAFGCFAAASMKHEAPKTSSGLSANDVAASTVEFEIGAGTAAEDGTALLGDKRTAILKVTHDFVKAETVRQLKAKEWKLVRGAAGKQYLFSEETLYRSAVTAGVAKACRANLPASITSSIDDRRWLALADKEIMEAANRGYQAGYAEGIPVQLAAFHRPKPTTVVVTPPKVNPPISKAEVPNGATAETSKPRTTPKDKPRKNPILASNPVDEATKVEDGNKPEKPVKRQESTPERKTPRVKQGTLPTDTPSETKSSAKTSPPVKKAADPPKTVNVDTTPKNPPIETPKPPSTVSGEGKSSGDLQGGG